MAQAGAQAFNLGKIISVLAKTTCLGFCGAACTGYSSIMLWLFNSARDCTFYVSISDSEGLSKFSQNSVL